MELGGEFEVDLSSRACDFDSVDSSLTSTLTTEYTNEGQDFKKADGSAQFVCIFTGRSSQNFATNFIKSNSGDATLLWRKFIVPTEPETTDENELKRVKQSVLSVYKLKQLGNNVLFVIHDTKFELGQSFIQQIINEDISTLIKSVPLTYIFQSEPVSKFYGNNYSGQSENYFLTSSSFNSKIELNGILRLPMPNLISGFGAAVLTYCEKEQKSCLLIVNYVDNQESSHLPFIDYMQSSANLKSSLLLSATFNGKTQNKVEQSNLYT